MCREEGKFWLRITKGSDWESALRAREARAESVSEFVDWTGSLRLSGPGAGPESATRAWEARAESVSEFVHWTGSLKLLGLGAGPSAQGSDLEGVSESRGLSEAVGPGGKRL